MRLGFFGISAGVAFLSLTANAASAAMIVDQSPEVIGTNPNLSWTAQANDQNFLMQFTLTSSMYIDSFSIFTGKNIGTGTSLTLRIRNDASNRPALTNLYEFTDTSSVDTVGTGSSGTKRVTASFNPLTLDAGTYWIGMSGTSEDIGWIAFNPYALYNTQYQLSGETLQGPPSVGKFAFQIEGGPSISTVPLPASAPLFAGAILALGAVSYGVNQKKAAAAA